MFALSMLLGAVHSAWDMRCRRQAGRLLAAAGLAGGDATISQELLQVSAMDGSHAVSVLELSASANYGSGGNGAAGGAESGGGTSKPLPGSPAGAAPWPLLAKAHLMSTEVACASELFLTVFYWALLYNGERAGVETMFVGMPSSIVCACVHKHCRTCCQWRAGVSAARLHRGA